MRNTVWISVVSSMAGTAGTSKNVLESESSLKCDLSWRSTLKRAEDAKLGCVLVSARHRDVSARREELSVVEQI